MHDFRKSLFFIFFLAIYENRIAICHFFRCTIFVNRYTIFVFALHDFRKSLLDIAIYENRIAICHLFFAT